MDNLVKRPRRLRANPVIRGLVSETRLNLEALILPLFVTFDKKVNNPIPSMPGHSQISTDLLSKEIEEISKLGIKSVLLFGIPEKKDEVGSGGYQANGIIPKAIKAIKQANPEILVITDICLCEYTSYGHCGPVKNGIVDNDATLPLIAKQALTHAQAGADMVAPSGMIDGMVGVLRTLLDDKGFDQIPIMSYSAKYASSFYGPFREAAECEPKFGDRKTYQMDPANIKEALKEVQLDIEQGADIVMVKPALAYLDVIKTVKENFNLPVAAYNVSGEFAMVKAASQKGWINEEKIMMEILTSIKRAGADCIITYFTKDVARLYAR